MIRTKASTRFCKYVCIFLFSKHTADASFTAITTTNLEKAVLQVATTLGKTILQKAILENKQFSEAWHNPDIIGGDQHTEFFGYVFDTLLDTHPELQEVFAGKTALMEGLFNELLLSGNIGKRQNKLQRAEMKMDFTMMNAFMERLNTVTQWQGTARISRVLPYE